MATGWLLASPPTPACRCTWRVKPRADRAHTHRLVIDVLACGPASRFSPPPAPRWPRPTSCLPTGACSSSLIVLAQLTGAVIETISHYFRGIGRSEIESAIQAAHRAVTLVWALIVLWWWQRLDYLGVAMLVPALVAMLVSIGDRDPPVWRRRCSGNASRPDHQKIRATGPATGCRRAAVGALLSAATFTSSNIGRVSAGWRLQRGVSTRRSPASACRRQ